VGCGRLFCPIVGKPQQEKYNGAPDMKNAEDDQSCIPSLHENTANKQAEHAENIAGEKPDASPSRASGDEDISLGY
jgi:hypothetical protein